MVLVEAEFAKFVIKSVQMSHPWVRSQRPFCGVMTCRDYKRTQSSLRVPAKIIMRFLTVFGRSQVLAALLTVVSFKVLHLQAKEVLLAGNGLVST
jgi:hypothetical protein